MVVKRCPPPPVPMALVSKPGHARILHVPEAQLSFWCAGGWSVLALDSDVPVVLEEGHVFDAQLWDAVKATRPFDHYAQEDDPA